MLCAYKNRHEHFISWTFFIYIFYVSTLKNTPHSLFIFIKTTFAMSPCYLHKKLTSFFILQHTKCASSVNNKHAFILHHFVQTLSTNTILKPNYNITIHNKYHWSVLKLFIVTYVLFRTVGTSFITVLRQPMMVWIVPRVAVCCAARCVHQWVNDDGDEWTTSDVIFVGQRYPIKVI